MLPNRIVYPSILLAMLLLAMASWTAADLGSLLRRIFAALALGGGHLVLRLIYPVVMGLGDVKLAVVLGAYLGYLSWGHLFYGTVLTFLLGGLTGIVLILSRKGSAKSAIPFGPFIFAGTILALLIPA
ncbi:prepilin peptidase [Renibacterium salmoninarum]|uniref:prepilin peptidase n=1 Tax=Renibacterium salmoninarum TaxID=1646 RepID=UPI002D79C4E7|nr:prepilin peptidase [Renibacterium salmoninarum]